LIIAGVGGQGNILASHIIAEAALEGGYGVTLAETYGGAMRGGSVFSLVKVGRDRFSPLIFEDSLDVLIGLEPLEALRLGSHYLSPTGTALVNSRSIVPLDVKIGQAKYPNVPDIIEFLNRLCKEVICFDANVLAEEAGDVRAVNVVMVGAFAEKNLLPISVEELKKATLKLVPKGTEEINLKAFELGRNIVKKTSDLSGVEKPA
jgi:indolepyruvate ferredoxin oxidoreductase beta subunit